MLDAMEARLAALRPRCAPENAPASAAALRAELRSAGISGYELARVAGVSTDDVDTWLRGRAPVPHWVPAAARLVALLTPSARHSLLYSQPGVHNGHSNGHPFSRIEEL